MVSDRTVRLGYLIALLGSVAFIVGCFLPLYGSDLDTELSVSLYQVIALPATSDRAFAIRVGGYLYLFSGAAIIGGLSLAGLLSEARRWIAMALTGASAVWALIWLGAFLSPFGGQTRKSGYWVLLAGSGGVVLGICLVVSGVRRNRDLGPDS